MHRTTSLVRFDSCPFLYHAVEENPAIDQGSVAAERGTAVHKAAEVYCKALVAGDSEAAAITKARHAVEGLRTTLSAAALHDAESFITTLFDQELPKPLPGEKWYVEETFYFDAAWNLCDHDSARFRGTIDLLIIDTITGEVRIFDWKTARQIEPLSELRTNLQLAVSYPFAAVAIAKRDGVEPTQVVVGRHYTQVMALQSFNIPLSEVAEASGKIDARIAAIEATTEWRPKPSGACLYCPAINLCPSAKAAGTASVAISDVGSAKVAYETALLWERLAEQAKDAVKAYINLHGAVPMGAGKMLDLKPIEKRVMRDDAIEILKETRGLDAETILRYASLSVGGLEKLVKKDPAAMAACCDLRMESRLSVVKG